MKDQFLQSVELTDSPHHKLERIRQSYPAIEDLTRPAIETNAAAYYLNRRPQTLRVWACRRSGPIRPLRINGRLAWRVSDIKALMGVSK